MSEMTQQNHDHESYNRENDAKISLETRSEITSDSQENTV
jgi:hypothetical protein